MLLQIVFLAMACVMDTELRSPQELEAVELLRASNYLVTELSSDEDLILKIGGWKGSIRGEKEMAALAVLAPRIVELRLCLVPIDDNLEWLSGATKLTHVTLFSSSLTDEKLRSFPKVKRLELLALTENEITDSGLAYFRDIEIERLGLEGTRITTSGLRQLRTIEALDVLILDHTKVDDGIWDVLSRCNRARWLERINLEHTPVTGRGISALNGVRIVAFSLRGTSFNNEGCEAMAKAIEVGDLDLSGTLVGDDGLESVGKIQSLGTLRLNNTNVTDEGLVHLKNLPELHDLFLHETKVTAQGIERLRTLRCIRPKGDREEFPGFEPDDRDDPLDIHWGEMKVK